jgi:hypothetical protein
MAFIPWKSISVLWKNANQIWKDAWQEGVIPPTPTPTPLPMPNVEVEGYNLAMQEQNWNPLFSKKARKKKTIQLICIVGGIEFVQSKETEEDETKFSVNEVNIKPNQQAEVVLEVRNALE